MDIYNMSGFKWWCKQRRNASLISLLFITFFIVAFGTAFVSSLKTNQMNNANIDSGAIILFLIMFFVFIFIVLSVLKNIVINIQNKVEQCWYGTITNFYIHRYGSSDNRKTHLYIVANVNGKEMDARCMSKTYRNAQVGQQVILFIVKGDKNLYCVHPEM